jgi:hypothetical protein
MRGEPDYALHEASPFGAARLLPIPNPEPLRATPCRANPIEDRL